MHRERSERRSLFQLNHHGPLPLVGVLFSTQIHTTKVVHLQYLIYNHWTSLWFLWVNHNISLKSKLFGCSWTNMLPTKSLISLFSTLPYRPLQLSIHHLSLIFSFPTTAVVDSPSLIGHFLPLFPDIHETTCLLVYIPQLSSDEGRRIPVSNSKSVLSALW